MDGILSIETDQNGATKIVTTANAVMQLTPEASATLANHLITAFNVGVTLMQDGRFTVKVNPRVALR